MSDAKIKIKIGAIRFAGEGNQEWLSKELDKILEKADKFADLVPEVEENTDIEITDSTSENETTTRNLSTFIKEKEATVNQVKKFLVTSVWLHDVKHKDNLQTSEVTTALSDAKQKKLTNASDSLNSNVKKGHCEKKGKEFFVTQEGRDSL